MEPLGIRQDDCEWEKKKTFVMRTASTDDARKLAAILLPETNGRNMTSHLRLVPEARATQCRSKLV